MVNQEVNQLILLLLLLLLLNTILICNYANIFFYYKNNCLIERRKNKKWVNRIEKLPPIHGLSLNCSFRIFTIIGVVCIKI